MSDFEPSSHADGQIIETEPAPFVRLFTFNRPQRRNALTNAMVRELGLRLASHASDNSVRVAILTGDDKSFSAGADIHEMLEGGLGAVTDTARQASWRSIETFRKPLIAAVRGFAYGAGSELAMLCDLVVAGRSARFAQPEVKLGAIAGDGGSQRLPRIVGRVRAARMLLTGEPITALEAHTFGLVSDLVDDHAVLESATDLAIRIAANAPLAVQATKRLVRSTDQTNLTDGLHDERARLYELFLTEDRVEGAKAFAEKRPPHWQGR